MGVEDYETGAAGMAAKPGLDPHYDVLIRIPVTFAECHAYTAGWRLFEAGEDEVPMLLRQGVPIDQYLEPLEIDARLELGQRAFERWFRLGWSRAAGEEES